MAVLLARGGLRTTLQTRTTEQAERLLEDRENRAYLPEVAFPRELRVEPASNGVERADYVLLGVPSSAVNDVVAMLDRGGSRNLRPSYRSPRVSSRLTGRRRPQF